MLPQGWQEQAKSCGALQRAREIQSASDLLRILLIHFWGCSLKETALRARRKGLGTFTSESLFKRLQRAESWLFWLVRQKWQVKISVGHDTVPGIILTDGSTVRKPGSRGTDYRLHYAMELRTARCIHCEVTGAKSGESWKRFSFPRGAIVLGDRYYSNPHEVAWAASQGWKVVVRANPQNLRVYEENGEERAWETVIRGMGSRELRDWPTRMRSPEGGWIEGRVVVWKLPRPERRIAQQRLIKRGKKMRRPVSERTLRLAGYYLLWTTLDETWSAAEVMELYPYRWQIELAFKRLKSIVGMRCVPKSNAVSARAWLYGKLLIALLVEELIAFCDRSLPRQLRYSPRRSLWRETVYLYREMMLALMPHGSLWELSREWANIVNQLSESKRWREYQLIRC